MADLHQEDGAAADILGTELASAVTDALHGARADECRALLKPLHHADVADLLERLSPNDRRALVDILRDELDPKVLPELDDAVRELVIEQLGPKEIAEAVAELETDDGVELVEDLEEAEQEKVLDALPAAERTLIEESLNYPEDSAGRLMQHGVIAVPAHWTVGQSIDFLREGRDLPQDFYDIYLVDSTHRPIGSISLGKLLTAHRHVALQALMNADMKFVRVDMDQEEVAFIFRQRDLVSAPVVDSSERLVGSITIDDVVDVIHEEHEEDLMRFGGVGGEDDLYSAVIETARRRAVWLAVHMVSALIASAVISFFDASIEQMVALAILMPVVAAMGGTAGTQTLTVSVRAIATRELTSTNALRVIAKEMMVGGVNGVLFAVLVGIVAWVWFGDLLLGGVVGAALVVNFTVSGLAGSALPFLLQRAGADPAIASSAFLISITDIIGFYTFLGLATLILL